MIALGVIAVVSSLLLSTIPWYICRDQKITFVNYIPMPYLRNQQITNVGKFQVMLCFKSFKLLKKRRLFKTKLAMTFQVKPQRDATLTGNRLKESN